MNTLPEDRDDKVRKTLAAYAENMIAEMMAKERRLRAEQERMVRRLREIEDATGGVFDEAD